MRVYETSLQLVANNNTVVSDPLTLENMLGFAVQAQWAGGTIAGTIKLEASIGGDEWDDVTGATQAITDDGRVLWNEADVFYKWVRVSLTSDDANNITADVQFFAKGA